MIYLLMFGAIILIIGLVVILNDEKVEITTFKCYVLSILGAYIVSGALMWLDTHRQPTAMDVYQGKTTLKITYRDGMAVDSVVVFKNE